MQKLKKLHIQILTDKGSWAIPYVKRLKKLLQSKRHRVELVNSESRVKKGDILVIFSWYNILSKEVLGRNKHNLVVHPSALPKGKGCSPLTWQILPVIAFLSFS